MHRATGASSAGRSSRRVLPRPEDALLSALRLRCFACEPPDKEKESGKQLTLDMPKRRRVWRLEVAAVRCWRDFWRSHWCWKMMMHVEIIRGQAQVESCNIYIYIYMGLIDIEQNCSQDDSIANANRVYESSHLWILLCSVVHGSSWVV